MSKLSRDAVVARLKQLPSLPSAVTALLASFGSDDVEVTQVAGQIARDQGLTARVLRVANSSFYGLQSRVGTINEAVVVLGFRAVRSMVLAVGVGGAFRMTQCPGFDAPAYLRHGVAVALAARAMAADAGQNPELAFTAGILHDIGELLLASNFSTEYAAVLAYRKQHDCLLVEAERDVLGMDHAEVGGLLAETWRFPASLFSAVAEHHAPAAALGSSLADLVHVADAIAQAMSRSPDAMVMPVDRTAWHRLGMTAEKLPGILMQVEAGMEETCLALSG